jgi:hypothetical protein
MRTIVALLVLTGAAWAQQDPSRFTEGLINRLKDRLKLNDDQVSKLRDILTKDYEDRQKMDEARTAKINEILDEDQRRQYEEFRRTSRGLGGPGGQQFRFGQGGQGFGQGGMTLDDFKRELTLTDEQAEKIKPLVDEFNAATQKRMEELRNGGFQGLDWPSEVQKFQDAIKALMDKVKGFLSDEQKSKADAYYERTTGWMRYLPGLQNRAGGADRGSRQTPEERVRRAVEALHIDNDAERMAIRDLIEKIVKAQADFEEFQRISREKLSGTARDKELSDTALEERIHEAQEGRRSREKEIAGLQKQLAESVNNRQEIELILQGILK